MASGNHSVSIFISGKISTEIEMIKEDLPVSAQEFPISRNVWIIRDCCTPSVASIAKNESRIPDSPIGIRHRAVNQDH
jgi:hypothetical protein